MNPSIPLEFYSVSDACESDWSLPGSLNERGEALLNSPLGSYNGRKVLPLQVILLQQIMTDPHSIEPSHIPDGIRPVIFKYLHATARLTPQLVSVLSVEEEELDLSFWPSFLSSSWLPQISSCASLRYVLSSMSFFLYILPLVSDQELSLNAGKCTANIS